jgi:methyl-accepting chemotaxis protein
MKRKIIIYISVLGLFLTVLSGTISSQFQRSDSVSKKKQTTLSAEDTKLDKKDRLMISIAKEFAKEIKTKMKKWLSSNELSEDKLFSYLYYPIADTNPKKFHTDYDKLSDRDIQPILEAYLIKDSDIIYALLTDKNGYIPTHNKKYSQPLTGNRAKDLVNNRTKRIFADKTGLAAARNEKTYLVQLYKRDTGQRLIDLSIPIYIGKRHWGAIRIGYLK